MVVEQPVDIVRIIRTGQARGELFRKIFEPGDRGFGPPRLLFVRGLRRKPGQITHTRTVRKTFHVIAIQVQHFPQFGRELRVQAEPIRIEDAGQSGRFAHGRLLLRQNDRDVVRVDRHQGRGARLPVVHSVDLHHFIEALPDGIREHAVLVEDMAADENRFLDHRPGGAHEVAQLFESARVRRD